MPTLLPLNTGFNEQFLCDVAIDWSHRLTNGLILSAYNSVRDVERPPINYVNGAVGVRTAVTKAAPALALAKYGTWNSYGDNGTGSTAASTKINGAAKFDGATSWARIPLDLSPWHDITVAFWYQIPPGSPQVITLEYGNPSYSASSGWFIGPNGGGGTMTIAVSKTSNTTGFLNSQISSGEFHHHIMTMSRDSNATMDAWRIDGVPASTGGTGSPPTLGNPWGANLDLNIGARNGGANLFSATQICGIQIWKRELRADEQIAVYREGWRMFKPIRRTPFPLMSASAAAIQSWFLVQ